MTATDQTPTTDSERAEQIRARLAAATKGTPRASNRPDDAVGNSSVVLDGRYIITDVPWDDAALYAHARDDLAWLLGILAEQAATIEAIRTARAGHPRCELHEDDEGWVNCGWKRAVFDIDAALGSQRTEGQDVAAGWADYLEQHDQNVGATPLTVDRIIALLRGPKPFGISRTEGQG